MARALFAILYVLSLRGPEGLLVDLTADLRDRRPAYLGPDDPANGAGGGAGVQTSEER